MGTLQQVASTQAHRRRLLFLSLSFIHSVVVQTNFANTYVVFAFFSNTLHIHSINLLLSLFLGTQNSQAYTVSLSPLQHSTLYTHLSLSLPLLLHSNEKRINLLLSLA